MSKQLNNGLTGRQARFCEEYIIDNNGTAAAVRAGYSEKGASTRATGLLKMPDVVRYLTRLRERHEDRTGVTVERVLNNLDEVMSDREQPGSARVSAATQLGKHLGMFTEKLDIKSEQKVTEIIRRIVD